VRVEADAVVAVGVVALGVVDVVEAELAAEALVELEA
jgi:hypothetical protein